MNSSQLSAPFSPTQHSLLFRPLALVHTGFPVLFFPEGIIIQCSVDYNSLRVFPLDFFWMILLSCIHLYVGTVCFPPPWVLGTHSHVDVTELRLQQLTFCSLKTVSYKLSPGWPQSCYVA